MKRRVLALFLTCGLLAPALAVTGVDAAPAAAAPVPAAPADATERVLFSDDFSANDGANWIAFAAGSTQITFDAGMATIFGGGPENRIITKDDILADDFTAAFDLFINEGNTNSAIKFGFLATPDASERFQVTYDGPKSVLRLERVAGGKDTILATVPGVELPVNTGGEPYRVEVSVEGDTVRAAIDGQQKLAVEDTGTAAAAQGRILVASQFPKQDYSIDSVRVTTSEAETAGTYTVDVATATNGVRDTDPDAAGGTLTSNRSSGDPGDVVTLARAAKPGYVFDGYDSYLAESGASTDGLLTITDDRFTINDKTGSVVIVANFVTEPEDPNVVFKDYFDGAFNDHGQYAVSSPLAARIADGELALEAGGAPGSVVVDNASWGEPLNYRITVDARKVNATAGTAQIAFRAGELADRYVLALNGSKALLRRLDSAGANVELASAAYAFDQSARTLVIDVSGDTVSVTSDGKPVLSYTNADDGDRDAADWSGLTPTLALLNMTAGAPVAFDNVKVSRTPIYVQAQVLVTNDGAADPDNASGAVVLSDYRTAAGEELTWETYPKGGYAFEGMYFDGEKITGDSFTVPDGTREDVTLTANFVADEADGTVYYVDSAAGDDANSGTAPDRPWASLAKLDRTFGPGDEIRIKRGSVFTGAAAKLTFRGSGSAAAPIIVGAYGTGARPRLDGAGEVTDVVSLYNQEFVHLTDVEITNVDPAFDATFALNSSTNKAKNLRAVNVSAKDFGVVRGITIRDLYIHDVNGNLASKWNGGIFFDVAATVRDGKLYGVPTKYDDVLIEGNTIDRVDRSGIKLVSSGWANQSLENAPTTPLNWYPSTGVVVRNNQIRHTGGDAITVRDTDGALIEYNLVRHARYQETGYNAGIWPFQATNTVIQYNEVSNTHGVQDGQGLDTDHVSSYSTMQYNYSHDNEGGFMLILNGFPHTAPTIRYNISQNDADKTFEFARGTAAGTMIYNNSIYSEQTLQGPRGAVLDLANSGAGTGNREVFIFNNLFHYPKGQAFYVGETETMKTKAKLYNNAYAGGIAAPDEEERAITGEVALPGVGTAPAGDDDATEPRAGRNAADHFAGYVPGKESVLRNAGVAVEDVVARYGGTVTDRRALTAPEVHELAKQGESIDFVAGRFLPEIDGVDYGTDFLGTPLPNPAARVAGPSEGITVGAIQYAPEETPEPTPEPSGSGEPSPEPSGSAEPTPSESPVVPGPTTGGGSATGGGLPALPVTGGEPTLALSVAGALIAAGLLIRRARELS